MPAKPRRFWSVLLVAFAPLLYSDAPASAGSSDAELGPATIQVRHKLSRRTLAALLTVVGFLVVGGYLFSTEPLQFTAFQGGGLDTGTPRFYGGVAKPWSWSSGIPVSLDPEQTFTYRVTIQNWGIVPVRVTGIKDVPGLPLRPVELQAMPDNRDPIGVFHPFILFPLQERDLLITSRWVCGGRVESERLQFSILGIPRQQDVPLLEPLQVEGVPC